MKKYVAAFLMMSAIILCSCSVGVKPAEKFPHTETYKNQFTANLPVIYEDKRNIDKICGVENFSCSEMTLEKNEYKEFVLDLYPHGIEGNEVELHSSDSSVIYLRAAQLVDLGDRARLTFEACAVAVGRADISVTTNYGGYSGVLTVTVADKRFNKKIFITPKGNKYHLDSKCAGKNAFEFDEKDALDMGYEPCKKCATA